MGSGGAGNGRQPEETGCLLLYSAFWYNQRENRKGIIKNHEKVKPICLPVRLIDGTCDQRCTGRFWKADAQTERNVRKEQNRALPWDFRRRGTMSWML